MSTPGAYARAIIHETREYLRHDQMADVPTLDDDCIRVILRRVGPSAQSHCKTHDRPLTCPSCMSAKGGKSRSAAKVAAARANGVLAVYPNQKPATIKRKQKREKL